MPCERKHVEAIRNEVDKSIMTGGYMDRIRSAISAALSACDQSQWRGMDSAPKDGTNIILFVDGEAHEGGWLTGEAQGAPSERYAGWWCVTGSVDEEPTHWMPLPEAPSAHFNPAKEG